MRMDGSGVEVVAGLERAHHDFAVLPGGRLAFLFWTDAGPAELVERAPDGSLTHVVTLDEATYRAPKVGYHPNALRYYAKDDSYTVSELTFGVSRMTRQGQVNWQLRKTCDGAPLLECATATVDMTHGHELLDNGHLLMFRVRLREEDPTPVHEFSFSEQAGALTANVDWTHVTAHNSDTLGDVMRLKNGNLLVVYSTDGVIQELSPTREVVQELVRPENGAFGYVTFRETLYGPPQ